MSANTSVKVEPVEANSEPPATATVADTGAGLLVFEQETEYRSHLDRTVPTAKRLVGFADVSDWSAIREALRNRGLGVGAVTNLPVFDLDELPDSDGEPAVLGDLGKVPAAWRNDDDEDSGRPKPSRSEPADFGGGETTGVQDL